MSIISFRINVCVCLSISSWWSIQRLADSSSSSLFTTPRLPLQPFITPTSLIICSTYRNRGFHQSFLSSNVSLWLFLEPSMSHHVLNNLHSSFYNRFPQTLLLIHSFKSFLVCYLLGPLIFIVRLWHCISNDFNVLSVSTSRV